MIFQKKRVNKESIWVHQLIWLGVLVVSLAACGGPYPDMSNYDLQEELWKCKSRSEVTPAMAVKCDNVKRECSVRKKAGRISTC